MRGAVSGKFDLSSFRSGGATTNCSLATSGGTFEAIHDADCSLGLRNCLFRRIVSFPVFTRWDLSDRQGFQLAKSFPFEEVLL